MWSSTRIVEVKQPLDHGLQQRLQVSNQKHGDEHGTAQGKKTARPTDRVLIEASIRTTKWLYKVSPLTESLLPLLQQMVWEQLEAAESASIFRPCADNENRRCTCCYDLHELQGSGPSQLACDLKKKNIHIQVVPTVTGINPRCFSHIASFGGSNCPKIRQNGQPRSNASRTRFKGSSRALKRIVLTLSIRRDACNAWK